MYIRPKFINIASFVVIVCFFYLAYLIWRTEEHIPDVVIRLHDLLSYVLLAVELGGYAVLNVNEEHSLDIQKKYAADVGEAELLTKADKLSNQLINNVLQRYPGLHVVSEEQDEVLSLVNYDKYQLKQQELHSYLRTLVDFFPPRNFFLSKITVWVDPLDGTQEFTEGLLEYVSVMVCISLDGSPIFGAIYRPFTGERVYGLNGFGIVKGNGIKWDKAILINSSKKVLISRSHAGTIKNLTIKSIFDDYDIEAAGGSGYKSLRLLNGTAALYLHKTSIKKWDTCAGDALLRSVGGLMLDFDGDALTYEPDSDNVFRKGLLAAAQYPFTYYQQLRRYFKELNF